MVIFGHAVLYQYYGDIDVGLLLKGKCLPQPLEFLDCSPPLNFLNTTIEKEMLSTLIEIRASFLYFLSARKRRIYLFYIIFQIALKLRRGIFLSYTHSSFTHIEFNFMWCIPLY